MRWARCKRTVCARLTRTCLFHARMPWREPLEFEGGGGRNHFNGRPSRFGDAQEPAPLSGRPQPPRRHCASHLSIAVRPAPKIRATTSGPSPCCARRAAASSVLRSSARAVFISCPHGIIRGSSGQETCALIYELINSPAIRRPPPKIAAIAASPLQVPGDQDGGRRAASVFCRAGCVARSHAG